MEEETLVSSEVPVMKAAEDAASNAVQTKVTAMLFVSEIVKVSMCELHFINEAVF